MNSASFNEEKLAPARSTDLPPPDAWSVFADLVDSRRAVRVFTQRPLPRERVRECIEKALLAPSSSNLQHWEFHWLRSAEMKKKAEKICFSQAPAVTAPELIVAVARTGTWKRNNAWLLEAAMRAQPPHPELVYYHEKFIPRTYRMGLGNFFGFLRKACLTLAGLFWPVPRQPYSRGDLRTIAIKSTALACQNLMMALQASGISSCPMEGFDAHRMRKLLGLPRDATPTMCIAVGYASPHGKKRERVRMPAELFIHEH